jgi:hypothetical protein
MLFAILAYHAEGVIAALTPDEERALMGDIIRVSDQYVTEGRLGPAARLSDPAHAVTLRGPGRGDIVDGPFAETKEQLLGFHLVQAQDREEAVAIARDLRQVNPTAVYEIRPVLLYRPGAPAPEGDGA